MIVVVVAADAAVFADGAAVVAVVVAAAGIAAASIAAAAVVGCLELRAFLRKLACKTPLPVHHTFTCMTAFAHNPWQNRDCPWCTLQAPK